MSKVWVLIAGIALMSSMMPTQAAKNYAAALTKSIMFYNTQRSGNLPANNPITWRKDSALKDCVVGGWYDAGDHIKFGLPLSQTVTTLLWSMYRFKAGYQKAKQLNQAYNMIKWPLDYMLKAWKPAQNSLVVQIGDKTDHDFWGRAEDMTMNRPCISVNTGSKGSDIAAGTAAALAVGSIVFKHNPSYSKQLLDAAKSLYTFAKNNRGVYKGAAEFYDSTGDKDELCEASMWLYRATKTAQYLSDAKSFVELDTAWAYDWDNKNVACQLLLFEDTKEAQYRKPVEDFLKSWMPGGSVQYTPCGLAWRAQWGTNRYAGNTAFIALLAAEAKINAASYRKWAVEQINYILGDNKVNGGCFSFQVGYGTKHPLRPHHADASCPKKPASCGWAQFNTPDPNPNVLQGALVGGPDVKDGYADVRTDYVKNEVTNDYNSGFQGALAGINKIRVPATNNKCPCNR